MHLAPHHSATEVGRATSSCCRGGPLALTGVPNPRIVCWLPRKQMWKAPPTLSLPSPQPTVSKSLNFHKFDFLTFFISSPPPSFPPSPRYPLVRPFVPSSLILPAHLLSLCVSPQLHPQWELFLLPVFCERATRSASPALSRGTLCKSACVVFVCVCVDNLMRWASSTFCWRSRWVS